VPPVISIKDKYKLSIIAPTCFYYQAPIFRVLASHPRIDLTVYFCSNEALLSRDVHQTYHTDSQWGDEGTLLEGFNFKFLRNYAPRGSYLKWPFGLINPGIWNEIERGRPDVVILMSWMNITWWLAVLRCTLSKVPFLYMTDANVQADLVGPKWKMWVKKFLLGKVLFRLAAGFLCAGTSNKQLYSYYGVPEKKLVPFAYSWGYQYLLEKSGELNGEKERLKAELGIPDHVFVLLYCGRLSKEKAPLDLLKAFSYLSMPNTALVFVGDGPLGPTLKSYVVENHLDSVYFFGFQGRKEVPKFYMASDVLVLPSRKETWGMVVNEALCFGLPVIASDQVGAAKDLVFDGRNGFSFPPGDIRALAGSIKRLVELGEEERQMMGAVSSNLMVAWARRNLGESMVEYLDSLYPRQRRQGT
jgi:glycosyltransferase involved in cell wall biosynthesis